LMSSGNSCIQTSAESETAASDHAKTDAPASAYEKEKEKNILSQAKVENEQTFCTSGL
jgi:hypothetical protein